ncbi:unnamed protein product, partial [marine sediment metagenome]
LFILISTDFIKKKRIDRETRSIVIYGSIIRFTP